MRKTEKKTEAFENRPKASQPEKPERPEEKPAEKNSPQQADHPKEIGGRGGLEPTRYGDWEKGGLISDF